jgi:regulator of replication initiation timing
MAMQYKMFTFNASSFGLDAKVEEFLRAKGAVTLDFGALAYVNSEAMPVILSELLTKSSGRDSSSDAEAVVAQLRIELAKFSSERQKLVEDNAGMVSQVKSSSAEISVLKEQVAGSSRAIDALRAENSRLAATKSILATQQHATTQDDKLRQSYEKLVKEFQDLRSQSIEAITSVKVLEEENDALREELEALRAQAKNVPPAKAG